MKSFAKTFVTTLAVSSLFATFALAGTVIPAYQDDESGYQLYRNLGGEMDEVLADAGRNSLPIQDGVDRLLVRTFASSEYQTSAGSCPDQSRMSDSRALERLDEITEDIGFE